MAGENPQTTMPPVPREPLIGSNGRMSSQWERWIQQIQRILSFSGGIAWQIVNKAGSRLSDIVTRPHSDLQNVEGTGTRHISESENNEVTALDNLPPGVVAKTGDAAYSARTITGTSGEVEVSNGTGVAGNPVIGLPELISTPRKFGGETNYSEFEADGTLVFKEGATVWRDENFSGAVSAIGPNAPSLVSWDTSSILIPSFPHTLTKELNLLREIDHAAKQGADIVVHMHLFPSDTNLGTAKFFCEYYIKNDGQPAVTGTLNATKDMSGTAWEELRLDLGTISSALLNQGTQIGLRLYRLSTDPGTYTHPVAVSTWGYHYQLDTVGSRQITAK